MPSIFAPTDIFPSPAYTAFSQVAASPGGVQPFVVDDNLWVFVQDNNVGDILAMQSTDGGTTWTEFDAANRPSVPSFGTATWDRGSTAVCVYADGSNNIIFKAFDYATRTWGAAFGALGCPTGYPVAVAERADGTLFVVYYPPFGSQGSTSNQWYAVYDPAGPSWATVDVDLGGNIITQPNWNAATMGAVMQSLIVDVTGRVHVFLAIDTFATPSPVWADRYFYQAVKTDNTLGSSYDFPGQKVSFGDYQEFIAWGTLRIGTPCIVGDSVFMPVIRNPDSPTGNGLKYPTVVVGTPLSNPVWSTNTGGLDPDFYGTGNLVANGTPNLWYDSGSGTIYAVYVTEDPDNGFGLYGQIRLCQSSDDGATWTGAQVWNLAADNTGGVLTPGPFPQPNIFNLSLKIVDGQQLMVGDANRASDDNPTSIWFGVWSTSPPEPLAVTCDALPDGTQGELYTQPLSITGGTPPYTVTATGLPPAVLVGNDGILAGVPKNYGHFPFNVTVIDSVGASASASCELDIACVEQLLGQFVRFKTPPGVTQPLIQVRALDENNDPMRGNGLDNFLGNAYAVAQIISQRLLLLQGEWWENLKEGTPLFQSLLGHATTSQAVALLLRQRILGAPYVTNIVSIRVEYHPPGRVFTFFAIVQTAFGQVTLTNETK